MKEELERVKKALAEKEKELKKEEEEVENMKTEIGLKAADRDEVRRVCFLYGIYLDCCRIEYVTRSKMYHESGCFRS